MHVVQMEFFYANSDILIFFIVLSWQFILNICCCPIASLQNLFGNPASANIHLVISKIYLSFLSANPFYSGI